MTLGHYIKQLRTTANMSQPQLAEKMDVEQSYLSKLENDTFSTLITDPKLQDISLLFARHAASADGLHALEEKKFDYWAKKWGL